MPATLAQRTETETIERFVRNFTQRPDVRIGPGDDCAVTALPPAPAELALTSDAVIDGVHFDAHAPPALVGRKAIARALSDLAAMGANPLWALLNVVAPGSTPEAYLDEIARGAAAMAEEFNLSIVGGDMARGSPLQLHVFAVGYVAPGRAITRSGGREGDILFVTGTLGGSRAGRHLTFPPRVREGQWLAAAGIDAMIDLTDGLATDLRHLCAASNTGADIVEAALPLSESVPRADPLEALEHALCDGEDYELLFAAPPSIAESLRRDWSARFDAACTPIGRLRNARDGIALVDRAGVRAPMRQKGYSHFA